MTSLRVRIGILGLALLAGSAAPASPAAAAAAPPPTVEEQRLDRAVPREILERSGFDTVPLWVREGAVIPIAGEDGTIAEFRA